MNCKSNIKIDRSCRLRYTHAFYHMEQHLSASTHSTTYWELNKGLFMAGKLTRRHFVFEVNSRSTQKIRLSFVVFSSFRSILCLLIIDYFHISFMKRSSCVGLQTQNMCVYENILTSRNCPFEWKHLEMNPKSILCVLSFFHCLLGNCAFFVNFHQNFALTFRCFWQCVNWSIGLSVL